MGEVKCDSRLGGVVKHYYRVGPLLAFIPGLIAVLIIILKVKEIRQQAQHETHAPHLSFKATGSDFKRFTLILALFTLGNSSNAFLILRARQLGVSVVLIPVLWLVYNLSCTLFSAPCGILSDKIGRRRTIQYSFILFAAVYLGFAFASSAWQVWGMFVLYGLYYGLSEGILRAYVADIAPSPVRATAYGIYHTTLGVSTLPASLIMGVLWQHWGAAPAFSQGALLAIISALLLKFSIYPTPISDGKKHVA